MTKQILCAMAAAAVSLLPSTVSTVAADQFDPMQCSVKVEYSLNNTVRLLYERDFVVGPDATYSDDFSTFTRFRFFDALLTQEDNVPVVNIAFDSDVSVFSGVAFRADLKVVDETHGSTTKGVNEFFTSATGAAGSHRTKYDLTCRRADQ